jgi:AraC-like DNA-binding protein
MPLRIVDQMSLEFFDPLVFAFLSSANVKAGINRIVHYKSVTSAAQVSVADTAEGIAMDYSWPPPYRAPLALPLSTQVLALWLIRLGTRVHVQPLRVISPELPTDMDAYREFFGVSVTQGRTHRMELRSIDAHRPLLTANPVLWQGFEPSLRKRLSDIEDTATTRENVRAALIELLPAGEDSIEAVARRLSVSVRTLQRHLQPEGVSFQSVLTETRQKLALHYLRVGAITTAEIAFLLGYKDVRSFNRAFRSWTGMSPTEARSNRVA